MKEIELRTKEEIEAMLADCKNKCVFWHNEVKKIESTMEKGQEIPLELDQAERQYDSWDQRVRTLEWVLKINNVI